MEDSQKSVTRGTRRTTVIAIIILSILVVGFAALYAMAAFGGSKSPVSFNKSGVCSDIIADYNASFEQADIEKYSQKLADSAKAASAINNNESDANCVYIQFTNAANTRNSSEVTKYVGILKSLASEGEYVTGQLANPLNISAIELKANAVTDGTGTDTNAGTGGNG
jgi:flagellar basal body-associated protein FliL